MSTAKDYYSKNKKSVIMRSKIWASNNHDRVNVIKAKYKLKARAKSIAFANKVKKFFKCKHCRNSDLPCLEFHHISNKSKLLSRMIKDGYSIRALKIEMRKCIILCSNCHRKETYKDSNSAGYSNLKGRYTRDIKSKSKCFICNENNVYCLDFHHTDDNKELGIGAMIRNKEYDLDDIKSEIDKCIVVCSNCHRKHHAGLITI